MDCPVKPNLRSCGQEAEEEARRAWGEVKAAEVLLSEMGAMQRCMEHAEGMVVQQQGELERLEAEAAAEAEAAQRDTHAMLQRAAADISTTRSVLSAELEVCV